MKKRLVFLFGILFLFTAILGAFGFIAEAFYKSTQTVKVFYPDGIPALTIAKLVKENPVIDRNHIMDYMVQNTPDALIAKVVSGEADIAIVPSNVTAQLYTKNLPYKLAATSGWGSLYVVSTQVLKNYNYLLGKKIFNIGQGLTPDIVFKYILAKNNVNINKDLRIAYLNSATELAPAFIAGRSKIAVMPEPMLTNVLMKKEDAKIYFDLNKEWMKLTGSINGYPQSSLIIKRDLIEKNRAFVDSFLAKYKESIEWGNKNPDKLGEYAEALSLSMNKTVVEKSISRANMKYVYIKDCYKDYQNYFKVLLDFAPKSIGGKLPDEGIFMEK
jgi:NitT/TauT family transport system substrate-binding protein